MKPYTETIMTERERELTYALLDMVLQYAYRTTFYGKEALCDGGLSSLENAFSVLDIGGRNGVITVKQLLIKIEEVQNE